MHVKDIKTSGRSCIFGKYIQQRWKIRDGRGRTALIRRRIVSTERKMNAVEMKVTEKA